MAGGTFRSVFRMIDGDTSVQELDYAKLRKRLLDDGQVLEEE